MKVTFMEEIEARKAWFVDMYCPQCDYGKYNIHQQLSPTISSKWWIECPNCGYECEHAYTRKGAIFNWQRGHKLC